MREIAHFNSTKERLTFLKGGYTEIIPTIAKEEEPKEEEKKPKKRKGKKKDEVQAE